ncbi:MAG: twin-arginine translocase TatA/TatE family subunit [Bryobacteraceae bacterium]
MGPFAWDKMVLIFLVVLVLFGPKELPKVARTIAKFMNDFKRASSELKETWQRELSALEHETQDLRKELDVTNDLTPSSSAYNETSYHHDSSYDYGSSGYPDSSADVAAAGAVTAAESTGEPPAEPATDSTVEPPPADMTEPTGSAPAAPEAAPVIAPAQGTVPTDVSITPAAGPHDHPAAS